MKQNAVETSFPAGLKKSGIAPRDFAQMLGIEYHGQKAWASEAFDHGYHKNVRLRRSNRMTNATQATQNLFDAIRNGFAEKRNKPDWGWYATLAARMDLTFHGPIKDMDDLFERAASMAEAFCPIYKDLAEGDRCELIDAIEYALRAEFPVEGYEDGMRQKVEKAREQRT